MAKRRSGYIALFAIVALLLAGLGYAYFIEPRQLVINRHDIAIAGLDPAFNGLKVVTIADIHGGSNYVTADRIREVVSRTNEQQPDLVVLLGDYVSEEFGEPLRLKMPMRDVADALVGIRARYGVYAVLGNHDGWYGDADVTAELRRVGIVVLQNELASIEINGKPLRIVGFKDHVRLAPRWGAIAADAREFLGNSRGQIIALEHSPDILPEITGEHSISPDLKLILAAHTHGGQVYIPLVGAPVIPSSYGQKYRWGHVLENGVDMLVTSGIGTSILPFRFLVPPEIAVLTLRRE